MKQTAVIKFLIFAYGNKLQTRGCALCMLNVTPQDQMITLCWPLTDKIKGKKRARGPHRHTRLSYLLCEK